MADDEQVKREPEPTYEVAWVKAANRDSKVALWDIHPQHPNRDHEIYLADGTPPVQAALTPEVQRALGDRRLVKSSEAELKVYYAESQRRQEEARAEEVAATPMAVPAPAPAPEPVADPDPEKRGPGRPAGNKAP